MRHHPVCCGFAFALLLAPGLRAEEEPDMGRALAATLLHQRELMQEAQSLIDSAVVRDRDASSGAEALDAFEAALVEQGLLAPGTTAEVAERGIQSRPKPPPPVRIRYPNLATHPVKPPAGDPRLLAQVGRSIHAGAPLPFIAGQWGKFLQKTGTHAADVNSLVQYVLRESYRETSRDLRFYADKVKHFNELKREIRAHTRTLREELAAAGDASRAKLEGRIKSLEGSLSSVRDDAKLANLDLQRVLQKQQQTLQTMSNVSKMLHDTAMAIIRKLGS